MNLSKSTVSSDGAGSEWPQFGDLAKNQRTKGFTLVEILAVLTIMVIIFSFAMLSMRGITGSQSVQAGVNQAAQLVELGRTEAIVMGSGARLVVDMDPSSSQYLRRLAVLRRVGVSIGSGSASGEQWQLTGNAFILPENVFLNPDSSSWSALMTSGFLVDFSSNQPQDGSKGALCHYIEYNGAGRILRVPGERLLMVFARGIDDGTGAGDRVTFPESSLDGQDGFLLRQAGNITHLDSPDQI